MEIDTRKPLPDPPWIDPYIPDEKDEEELEWLEMLEQQCIDEMIDKDIERRHELCKKE